jgi:hypothetical protein
MSDPIRQLTLTPALTALVKDVFGPSAKLIGTEIKSYLKERFDDARERRRNENLAKHISAVRAVLPKPPPEQVPYERLDMFSEWVDGAQDVDDGDRDLAAMWREILRQIIEGQSVNKSLITVMKEVDAQMAELLLRFRRKRGPMDEILQLFGSVFRLFGFSGFKRFAGEDLFNAKRLEAIGLLDRDYSPIILWSILFGTVFWGAYFAYQSGLGLDAVNSFGSNAKSILIPIGLLIGALFLVVFTIRTAVSRPAFRLNWSAKRLLSYAKKHEEREESRTGQVSHLAGNALL